MKHKNRVYERVLLGGQVKLTAPDQEDITGTLVNISLGGLLVSELSNPIDKTAKYKTIIFSVAQKPILLSVQYARQNDKHVGMRIIQYHLNGKEQLEALIDDLKQTNELVELLDEGWLDELFEDGQGINLEEK